MDPFPVRHSFHGQRSPVSPSPQPKRPASAASKVSPDRSLVRSSNPGLRTREKTLEGEYVRNLQQQLYLLELETRYLKEKNGGGKLAGPSMPRTSNLDDAMKTLKYKYVELQDSHSKELQSASGALEEARSQAHMLMLTVQSLERERDELRNELQVLKDQHTVDKEMLYGESASTSRKLEVAASEIARLQNLLTMANQDRDKARAAATASQAEASRYKDQVDELFQLNSKGRSRIDQLSAKVAELQLKVDIGGSAAPSEAADKTIKELQAQKSTMQNELSKLAISLRQEEHLRRGITEDLTEATRKNVDLCAQVEELRNQLSVATHRRDEMSKSAINAATEMESIRQRTLLEKEELDASRIALTARDNKIAELSSALANVERQLSAAKDQNAILESRFESHNEVLRSHEDQMVKLTKEKSTLTDQIKSLKAAVKLRDDKLASLTSERNTMVVQLERAKKEVAFRTEATNLKLQDFRTLMAANLKVADSIGSLMGKLQDMDTNDAQPVVPDS